jgi:hypothetical protein
VALRTVTPVSVAEGSKAAYPDSARRTALSRAMEGSMFGGSVSL